MQDSHSCCRRVLAFARCSLPRVLVEMCSVPVLHEKDNLPGLLTSSMDSRFPSDQNVFFLSNYVDRTPRDLHSCPSASRAVRRFSGAHTQCLIILQVQTCLISALCDNHGLRDLSLRSFHCFNRKCRSVLDLRRVTVSQIARFHALDCGDCTGSKAAVPYTECE